MFELSLAFKYLAPRWRQLSVSIISLISILVISLVVWLIVVFFSVTHGLEKNWIQKLIALTAPLRLTPTEAYYRSYYYQIDQFSAHSNYTTKTINEKLQSSITDPYNPEIDSELPLTLISKDTLPNGDLKDIVVTTFQSISSLSGLIASDFEIALANIRLKLLRWDSTLQPKETFLNQTAYIGSVDPNSHQLSEALLPLAKQDFQNLFNQLETKDNEIAGVPLHSPEEDDSQLSPFLAKATIDEGGKKKLFLPVSSSLGEAVLLPKSFREGGARLGDHGYLSYYSATVGAVQEQQLPIYVAGFYDPGIIPIGGKFILTNKSVTGLIRSAHRQNEAIASNGINIWFEDLEKVDDIKKDLELALEQAGVASYWHIQTYRDYEFTRDLIQQLRSERNLWSLIATVIIIVACSNIISMLIILVNDKKQEIGILRSMGASSWSIAFIFGFCGIAIGFIGSLIGIFMALLTLHNLQFLIDWIGNVQGHQMFNPIFYGNTLPNQMSGEALFFVITATVSISLIAGIIPAVKASILRPSSILRAE